MRKQIEKRAFWYTERTTNGVSLLTSTGIRNMTRVAEYQGLAGNRKEASWNKSDHQHDCCESKVSYRHKNNCPRKVES